MRTFIRCAIVLSVALCFVVSCTKETERIVYENNPGSPCGKIVGVVVQKESGARIYVKQVVIVDSTVIDPETGAFEFDSLTAGNYDMLIMAESYGTYQEDVMVFDESITYVGEISLSKLPDLIYSYYPDDNAEIVVSSYYGISVIINFTDAMDRESVEEAFSTEPPTEGTFYWSQSIWNPYYYYYYWDEGWGNLVPWPDIPGSEPADITTFTHIRCLQYRMESRYVDPNTEYRIILSTAAHDTAGNHLLFALEYRFRTIESTQTQTAILSDPGDGAENVGLRNYESIYVTFPKRMDQVSVENAITMTPVTDVIYLWPEDNKLKIYTGGPLMADTLYVLTIDATAKDLDGVSLEEPFQFSFTTEPFVITGTFPDNGDVFIERTPTIYINFNTYVVVSTFSGAFSISPDVGGRFEWKDYNQQVRYYPIILQPLTKYTISIDAAVTDYFGTPLKEPYEFSFVTRPD
ncbi:MAG: Ig-like domain-containing protein [Gemmatimonadota bacterium]|nr:MAG: Ig-like domain-containing protein [Gemmatimonadota bacterium]